MTVLDRSSWSRRREGMHPVRQDFASLSRREVGECMAQFKANFEHISYAALAQIAQKHKARQEPFLCQKVRLAALRHKHRSLMPAKRHLLAL
jgi:hypothetical protein